MNIVIAAGGTGGHLIPAIRTAEQLRTRGHKVRFAGSFRMGTDLIERKGFEWVELGSCGLTSHNPVILFRFLICTIKSIARALMILRRWNPDRVAGFGGYPSFPVVLSSWLLRIPVLIHEQNVIPGKANKLLSFFVKRIAISFPHTFKYWKNNKMIITGCPANIPDSMPQRDVSLNEWKLSPQRKTILIFGGSQGSRCINEAVMQGLLIIQDKSNLQIIHIVGKSMRDEIQNFYEKNKINSVVMDFCHQMDKAYACADVVIARAGALTVIELGTLGKKAVLIPYPYAGGHQKANALVLKEIGLAEIIEENHLSGTRVAEVIARIQNVEKDNKLNTPADIFPFDAMRRLADEIEKM